MHMCTQHALQPDHTMLMQHKPLPLIPGKAAWHALPPLAKQTCSQSNCRTVLGQTSDSCYMHNEQGRKHV
jgi:hypothetical protein